MCTYKHHEHRIYIYIYLTVNVKPRAFRLWLLWFININNEINVVKLITICCFINTLNTLKSRQFSQWGLVAKWLKGQARDLSSGAERTGANVVSHVRSNFQVAKHSPGLFVFYFTLFPVSPVFSNFITVLCFEILELGLQIVDDRHS